LIYPVEYLDSDRVNKGSGRSDGVSARVKVIGGPADFAAGEAVEVGASMYGSSTTLGEALEPSPGHRQRARNTDLLPLRDLG
jgi:hypothetical protein